MANKEQQIKNSFIYLLPIIIGSVLSFIALSIFTRILTREDYGVLEMQITHLGYSIQRL